MCRVCWIGLYLYAIFLLYKRRGDFYSPCFVRGTVADPAHSLKASCFGKKLTRRPLPKNSGSATEELLDTVIQ